MNYLSSIILFSLIILFLKLILKWSIDYSVVMSYIIGNQRNDAPYEYKLCYFSRGNNWQLTWMVRWYSTYFI